MTHSNELTPQERLAISRRAIIKHMNRDHSVDISDDGQQLIENTAPRKRHHGAWESIKHSLLVWWHRHPASAAVELAMPMVNDFSQAHPFKLLGISAGVGAAMALVRPWRMVSLGGLLVAAFKSSGLSTAVLSLLSRPKQNVK